MGVAVLGKTTPNESIVMDPRFILWDRYKTDVTDTSRLYAWTINNSGSDIVTEPLQEYGGVSLVATVGEFSISQKIAVDFIEHAAGDIITASVKLSASSTIGSMNLIINGTPVAGSLTYENSIAHLQVFNISTIDRSTISSVEFNITFGTANMPLNVGIEYLKLEVGNGASECENHDIVDEVNRVDSIAGKVLGAYGRTLYSEDVTGRSLSLNMFTLDSGAVDKMSIICKTDAGAGAISNFPILTPCSFYMDINLVKSDSPTAYVIKQVIYLSDGNQSFIRYAVDGVFTDWSINVSPGLTDVNGGAIVRIWTGTASQYDALEDSGKLDSNTVYILAYGSNGHLLATLNADKKLESEQIPNDVIRVVNESSLAVTNVEFVINNNGTVSIRY